MKVGIQSFQLLISFLDSSFHGNDDFCKRLFSQINSNLNMKLKSGLFNLITPKAWAEYMDRQSKNERNFFKNTCGIKTLRIYLISSISNPLIGIIKFFSEDLNHLS